MFCRREIILGLAASGLVALFFGCGAETRQKMLSTFFDGTDRPPPPTTRVRSDLMREIEELKRQLAEARAAAQAKKEDGSEKRAELPIERAKTWEEAANLLPKDSTGQVDWVQALNAGAIAPRRGIDPGAAEPPIPPFTVERVPKGAAIFKAVYPHEPHIALLSCENCHRALFEMKGGDTPITMPKIFAGEFCGACHGKIAFDPKTSCPRCHTNFITPEKEAVENELSKVRENSTLSTPEIIERGKSLYLEACAVCHGEKGDGKGPLAGFLDPKPRDFTAGKFKFRSTPSSSPAADFDLFRTITLGLSGTSMPGFSMLPDNDRWALVHFIKSFSERFTKDKPAKPILLPEPPPTTAELIQKGKELYKEAGCDGCHGVNGKGDGPSASDLKDEWGNLLRPFDFTSGRAPKAGDAPKDIYRAIMTGLQGTPMPDFGEAFEPEQAWSVVYFVLSLKEEKRGNGVKGDIVFQRKAGEGEVPPAVFPHWFHRVRFKCYACHPAITAMKAGANKITMDAIGEGKFCGACHNGKTAWEISFNTCPRCHVEQ